MDFGKYSKQRFDALGLDSQAARLLADRLQEEVAEEIQGAVLPALLKIVAGLNAQGHGLAPDSDIVIGDLSFRDESAGGNCRLRLACDFVISAGYSHTVTPGEAEAESELNV